MARITEDFVSYEVAKLLKEKGFSENTICKYADIGGITERWYDDYRERVVRFHFDEGYLIEPSTEPKDQYEIIGDTIPAPTHQMAMKWLRERCCYIVVNPDPSDETESTMLWWVEIMHKTDYKEFYDFDTYEEAVEAALKYCLINLI